MAEKLIPGITHATRISILQQIDGEYTAGGTDGLSLEKEVLQSVLSSDETRNEAVRIADCKPYLHVTGDQDMFSNTGQYYQKVLNPKTPCSQFILFVRSGMIKRRVSSS